MLLGITSALGATFSRNVEMTLSRMPQSLFNFMAKQAILFTECKTENCKNHLIEVMLALIGSNLSSDRFLNRFQLFVSLNYL
jgi:hypothetical protein